jgi:C4-dicarboxylate-specific signal transduction histidine kinase
VNLEVLRRKLAAGAADAALERANVVDEEVLRVHTLVDQLLQLVRPPRAEAGPVSLDDALDELRPLLEVQAKSARAGFQMSADSGLFAKIERDALKFAVLNLIVAIYTNPAEDESITIEIRASGADAKIAIGSSAVIQDDGNPFVQYARELISSAGGELEILERSSTGKGSTAVLRVTACSSFA